MHHVLVRQIQTRPNLSSEIPTFRHPSSLTTNPDCDCPILCPHFVDQNKSKRFACHHPSERPGKVRHIAQSDLGNSPSNSSSGLTLRNFVSVLVRWKNPRIPTRSEKETGALADVLNQLDLDPRDVQRLVLVADPLGQRLLGLAKIHAKHTGDSLRFSRLPPRVTKTKGEMPLNTAFPWTLLVSLCPERRSHLSSHSFLDTVCPEYMCHLRCFDRAEPSRTMILRTAHSMARGKHERPRDH